ncbi:MAG: 16S rRNA (adenine(1518)-N(6)/adenine(1519)-N(6))-dimethyltransferase RsmA [Parvularculaceae bacterium]
MSDLPPLREVIARHELGALKAFGQHFLLDLNITRKIASAADAKEGDLILEIGPGPGGLTRALLETGAEVTAIERDRRCIAALEEVAEAFDGRLKIVEADALKTDERALAGGRLVKIVSNLPYNISTELLVKWLLANHEETPLWSSMTLMFQKEVADRILAAPGSKTYGRLSVIAQAASLPKRAFDLPARAFTPPPKVQSSVVVFDAFRARVENIANLERVTAAAFGQRRKMLRSSLRTVFGEGLSDALAAVGVADTARAEEINVRQFLDLAEIAKAK